MKFFVILSLLATLIFSQTPNVYSSLGDKIYASVNNMENIKRLPEFSHLQDKIDNYLLDVEKARKDGIAIDSGDNATDNKVYLKKLRELSSEYDYFKRSVYSSFKSSIKDSDSRLFSSVVNSGMMDVKEHKKDILDYYYRHSDEINPSGVIEELVNEDAKTKKRRKTSRVSVESDKIKRLRANDKLQEAAEIRRLEAELKERKRQIREYQQRELSAD